MSLLPVAMMAACVPTNQCTQDHARLKEHVSSMQGGLEASVHEGGESAIQLGQNS